jgi:hypothetical protein
MFILNGIAYASENVDYIEVTDVKPLEDGMLLLTFNNNENRLFDTTILNGPVYEPLKNDNIFKAVYIEDGVVTWKNGEIDCAPEYMYENSYAYSTLIPIKSNIINNKPL